MKTKLLICAALFGFSVNFAFAQTPANASLDIRLPGTSTPTSGASYNPSDVVTFDLALIYGGTTPANVESVSYWFEIPNALAAFIEVTSQDVTGSTFNIAFGLFELPEPFDNSDASTGHMRHATDLGQERSAGGTTTAGTYFLANLDFTLTNAPVGTYILRTTTGPDGPLTSVSDAENNPANSLPVEQYSITIVPEPSTWALIGIGMLGIVGVNRFRARRKG